MMQSVAILGRQPALGIAELESLYGADKLTVIGEQAVLIDMDPSKINFSRLGGTIKLAQLLSIQDTADWQDLQIWLKQTVPQHLQYLPEGKLQLGISTYGLHVSPSRINASGLELKKAIRTAGRSVRLVPNKTSELNSAQVLHNHLTGPLGWELLFIRDGSRTYAAQTVHVQDIEAYAARDQARPKRDARVGMLPPKLAQIIINLAVGQVESTVLPFDKLRAGSPPIRQAQGRQSTVLDPFCGTGVMLQEALLMGYEVYGTDLEPRMVEYSATNLKWLSQKYNLAGTSQVIQGDATNYSWQQPVDLIAAETYLGRPFSALPNQAVLEEVMRDVDTIHRKFLRNVARQTKPGFRMCIAIPAWKTHDSRLTTHDSFKHLPMLDQLTDLGYTRTSFVHASNQDLIYHRPEQVVARELVVLTRK